MKNRVVSSMERFSDTQLGDLEVRECIGVMLRFFALHTPIELASLWVTSGDTEANRLSRPISAPFLTLDRHLRGSCTTPDTRQGTCGVPEPFLTDGQLSRHELLSIYPIASNGFSLLEYLQFSRKVEWFYLDFTVSRECLWRQDGPRIIPLAVRGR